MIYIFMHIYFFYLNIQLYFFQYFEYSLNVPLIIFFFCYAFQNSCLHIALLCFYLYEQYCSLLILPRFLLSYSIFWAQDLPPLLLCCSFFYCISFSTLYTLYPYYFFLSCFLLPLVSYFQARPIPHITYLFQGKNPYPQLLWVWIPQFLHPSHFIQVATILSVIYSLSNRSAPSSRLFSFSQYSCAFFHTRYASLLFSCYAFCGLAAYAVFSSFFFLFLLGHFQLWCFFLLYLKQLL